ncbi:class II aldolase/adducin family protein [Methanobrevibacter sp. DSM 116169]|uniref:class II aldolase/adducin family protein n=1 Tax=Methanobrevibacter sp. DSM 116169 TaxID=3242727 RepID=UPI0038FC03AB
MKNQAKEIVDISKYLYQKNLVSGKSGNISSRFKGEDGDIIAITPTLASLDSLEEKDVILVDSDGNCLTKGIPSSEVHLHLSIYKKRDDVNGIVHTHSPYVTGFAFTDKKIKRHDRFGKMSSPYYRELEYEAPGTKKLADKASEAIEDDFVLVLKDHGLISVADSLKEAAEISEFVEGLAKTQFISHMLHLSEKF